MLNPNEILKAEFQYAADAAFQANEDRARVTQYYLVTFGTLIGALISIPGVPSDLVWIARLAFGVAFGVLAIMGYLTLRQLIQLRKAWLDSLCAMNQIKDYYVQHVSGNDLAAAFRWTTETIPPPGRRNSIAYSLALMTILLASFALGIAAVFVAMAALGVQGVIPGTLVGLVLAVAALVRQMQVYRQELPPEKPKEPRP
jgi:hypothetical protein